MENDEGKDKSSLSARFTTITSVSNPLKFFALALLIVEPIVGLLAAVTPQNDIITIAFLATFMFIFVVIMVVILAFKKGDVLLAQRPSELGSMIDKVAKEQERLEQLRQKKQEFIGSGNLVDIINEAIPANQIPEILIDESKGGLK